MVGSERDESEESTKQDSKCIDIKAKNDCTNIAKDSLVSRKLTRKKIDFATLTRRHIPNSNVTNQNGSLKCIGLQNCKFHHDPQRPDLYNIATDCPCLCQQQRIADSVAINPTDREIISNLNVKTLTLADINATNYLPIEEKIIPNRITKTSTSTATNDVNSGNNDNNNTSSNITTTNNANKVATNKSSFSRSRLSTLAQIGEDWLYLASLGAIMAIISFSMDSVIQMFFNNRLWLFRDLNENNLFVQYLAWCLPPIILVAFSTGFVHLCSPTAIGSGIPEMKTILRGVILNEYLTFRTLIAKIVGLTCTLGSGLPLGKEGPFVHMASIVATLLSKLVASFQGIYENESRSSEMLSAACAVVSKQQLNDPMYYGKSLICIN